MKIAVITSLYPTPLYPNGGVFIVRRIAALQKLGCQVDAYALVVKETRLLRGLRTLLHRWPNEEMADYIPTDDSSVQLRAIKVHINLIEFIINTLLKERLFIYKVQKQIKHTMANNRYEVIHGHWLFPTGAAVVHYANATNTPCVITAHGSDVHRDMRKFQQGCLWTLEHCTKAEFVSQALLDTAIGYGYSGKNAQVLPNGIVPTSINHAPYENRVVGFVGSLIPVKRADQFPEIFHAISQLKPDVQFVIVGDGSLRAKIEQKMHNLNVHFLGQLPHEQVFEAMALMDVLIIPSRNEGWPCVAIEANACGVPVVGSDNGGIPEAIGDERLIVKESDTFISNFANRVVNILNGKIIIDKSALIRRANTYTWHNLQQKEISVYQQLAVSQHDNNNIQ